MLIDATHAEETRVVVSDGNKVEEFDFESLAKRQLAGNIYLAKVTRVEPSLQAAFVDYGGNRHGFLAFGEIHPDYYQIPVEDRLKLIEEEAAHAKAVEEEETRRAEETAKKKSRKKPKAQDSEADPVISSDPLETDGDDTVIEFDDADTGLVDVPEASSGDENTESEAEETASEEVSEEAETDSEEEVTDENSAEEVAAETEETEAASEAEEKPKSRRGRRRKPKKDDAEASPDDDSSDESDNEIHEEVRIRKPRPRRYKIQEVVKVRQILLVQVVKEERGNKGAALTTYLSLAGRYCVLMPNTARGGGISRKITNASDRKKIKEITNEIEVPQGAGLIVRTAGAKRTKSEIKRDYSYLLRQWEQIRDLTLKSIAPTQIYAEGDLIKRSIRDLYNRDIDEIIVEGDAGFNAARDYMKMLMPTHVKNVVQYKDSLPLFSRYQVENYLSGMFNPTVQLKSGGYIVIGITEALVAVDVNSGRATKEGSIEETALRTNLEAAEEVARQARLRDLAGLIVIDFIDMEERRNNSAVEKRLKEKLKNDRARIQVGRISGFGLLEMSRQRLRPGMLEATTAPCPHCHGTGLLRSDNSQALSILREIEEEAVRKRSKEVLVTAPVSIANYLLNQKREHISDIEARFGLSVRVEGDVAMTSPDFNIERLKTATRIVAPVVAKDGSTTVTVETTQFDAIETEEEELAEDKPKKKRRRRKRGGRGRNKNNVGDQENNSEENSEQSGETDAVAAEKTTEESDEVVETTAEKPADEAPKKRTRRRKKADVEEVEKPAEEASEAASEAATETAEEAPVKKKRAPRKRTVKKADEPEQVAASEPAEEEKSPEPVEEAAEKPKRKRAPRKKKEEPKELAEVTNEPVEVKAEAVEPEAVVVADAKPKPKRRGWWSRG